MAWHPTLDDLERRSDAPWTRPRHREPVYAEGTRPGDMAAGGCGCWCGEPQGHAWPGKANGAPHPREATA